MSGAGSNTKLHMGRMTQIALMTAVISVVSPWMIMVPISPVPVSFALFAVLLAAYLLGAKDGMICCGLYLAMGGMGLPVFSGGVGGPGKLLGPTGGYLIGYVVAAGITGYAAARFVKRHWIHIAGMVLGVWGCYGLGTLWLCITMDVGISEGITIGVLPYIPADLVKIVLVYVLGYELRQRIKRFLLPFESVKG